MKVPKTRRTYCPKCKTHSEFSISLYKKGRDRQLAEGNRKHERKDKGYGGQKDPRQRKTAKTSKKESLKLKCKTCGYTIQKPGIRIRKLEIEA
jgi:large subunit ribosomal protein L44e